MGTAQPVLTAFVEEVHDNEDLPLPSGAPDFVEARAAYSRARWMGPGRGWVDPVAEKKGAILGLDAGLSTLEIEVGENVGEDWEEVLDQRQLEIESCLNVDFHYPAGRRRISSPARQLKTRRKSESTSSGSAAV